MNRLIQIRNSGFALAEALVALLLLSVATIGAGTAMVQSLAGQRAALLRMHAADLAADLAEALRSAPDAPTQEAEISMWQAAMPLLLPGVQQIVTRHPRQSGQNSTSLSTDFEITLQWRDGRAPSPSTLALPVSLARLPEQR